MNKVIIELNNLTKQFDDESIVKGISLQIYENEFLTLLGPSGCGKTTTLRMIGGFEKPNSGEIVVNGKVVNDLPPYARPINTVFQRYALFPHLNVYDNIAFGLKNRGIDYLLKFYGEDEIKKEIINEKLKVLKEKQKLEADKAKSNPAKSNPDKVKKALDKDVEEKIQVYRVDLKKKLDEKISESVTHALSLVKLKGYEKRKITQLSGGQQQRVALARAIVNKPKILLLDEPLAALDLKLRQNMQYELKEMQRKLGITFIFVTHDQEEAMTMSDRIVVMKEGIIEQLGTPKKIYNEPVNRYVATFIGESNIIRGVYVKKDLVQILGVNFECMGYDFKDGEVVDVVIRPEDFDVVDLDKAKLEGIVKSAIFKGVHNELVVDIKGVEFLINTYENYNVGDDIGLKVDPYEIHIMKVNEDE